MLAFPSARAVAAEAASLLRHPGHTGLATDGDR